MTLFRIVLALMFLAISGYTAVVVTHHGLDLFSVFFGDMAKLRWPGQFNLDFMCLLALSALWVSYRHRFRPIGLLLGLGAFIGGVSFLSVYLLVESVRTRGDVPALLGARREPPCVVRSRRGAVSAV